MGQDASPTLSGNWTFSDTVTVPLGKEAMVEFQGKEVGTRYNSEKKIFEFGGDLTAASLLECYSLDEQCSDRIILTIIKTRIPFTFSESGWQVPAGNTYVAEFSQMCRYLDGKYTQKYDITGTATIRVLKDKLVVSTVEAWYDSQSRPPSVGSKKNEAQQWNTSSPISGLYHSKSVSGEGRPLAHVPVFISADGKWMGFGKWDFTTPMTHCGHNFAE
jgi:hypothetical protein